MKDRRIVIVLVAICTIGLIAYFLHKRTSEKAAQSARESQQAANRAVPVVAAPVVRRDVPIYLDGLGTVTAFKTIAVHSQVDGRLDQVLFREGQAVRAGDRIAQIDPRPFVNQLHQAQGALDRDRAQLRGARANLQRFTSLAAQKLIAQQQADDQAALVGQLEGAVLADQATIDTAKLNIDYANIRSPIDGVTGVRLVDPGNIVHPSDATGIVLITQLEPISVLFSLPQDELTHVLQQLSGQEALPVEAWSRDGSQKLATGQLALVDNQINASTATLRLKAVFPNPQHLLWPNQFVKARLLLTTRKNALTVPSTVPQRGPEGTFAYVIQDDQTVQPKPVEVETTEGDLAVIAKGLTEGQQVVADGASQLRAGAKVQPRQAGQPAQGRQPREGGAAAGEARSAQQPDGGTGARTLSPKGDTPPQGRRQ
jgi:multidrug efflux system membrane fusion protein